jgi:integrase
LADAVKDGLIRSNPATGAMNLPRERPALQFWTSEELTTFLKWLDQRSSAHEQALYRLAAQTGMRRGELLGLRWFDLDLDKHQVTIVQQLARRNEFGAPKTRSSRRTVDLSRGIVAALKAHRDAQDRVRQVWDEAYQDHGLVFAKDNGTPHDPRVVTHRFAKHIRAAGVKRIRFHDLRHTSAVIGLRELGEWPDEVSKRLGHTSVAFTLDTYGHLLPQRGREAAEAFDRLLADRRRTDSPPPD